MHWTIRELERLHQRNPDLLVGVRGNMDKNSSVRFGILGRGIKPNYRVVRKNGRRFDFSGATHRLHHHGPFEDRNLSEPFTYEEIEKITG